MATIPLHRPLTAADLIDLNDLAAQLGGVRPALRALAKAERQGLVTRQNGQWYRLDGLP